MPPTAGIYPTKGPMPPTAENYPKQEANAANGGNLPQARGQRRQLRETTPSRGQRRQRRESTSSKRPTPPAMGNYPRTGEYQSNHGKTVTSTPYRKRLPQRQETGQIHSTAFSYGNLRKQKLPLRQSLHYPQTGNRMYHILDGTPGYEPPRRGTRGAVCYSWVATYSAGSAGG